MSDLFPEIWDFSCIVVFVQICFLCRWLNFSLKFGFQSSFGVQLRFWGWDNTSPKLALRFMHPYADFSLPPSPSSLGLLSGTGEGGVWAIITGSVKHQCEWEVPFLRIFKFIDTKLCVSRVINTKRNNNGIKKGFYTLINLVYFYLF